MAEIALLTVESHCGICDRFFQEHTGTEEQIASMRSMQHSAACHRCGRRVGVVFIDKRDTAR